MITSTGEYAIRAMIHMAKQPSGSFILARNIGSQLEIPEHYLSNVLGELTRKGLLIAQRGRGGGFRISSDPERVTVFDVLQAVGRIDRFEGCILGYPDCGEDDPCAMHFAWKEIKEKILVLFREVTISTLARQELQREDNKRKMNLKRKNGSEDSKDDNPALDC